LNRGHLAYLDTLQICLAACLKVGMRKLPDILLDLSGVVINVLDLKVSHGSARLISGRTFEKPYLLSWRTKLEKLEWRNVWGLVVSFCERKHDEE
jgi:hypothetical protein